MKAELIRVWKDEKQTLGELSIGDFSCFTLELPDLNDDGIENNERRKSCIPDGTYPVIKHNSPKFGWCFWVKEVPGRDGILIHPGVHHMHTLGCILPGTDQMDITNDDLIDNTGSRKAMKELLKHDITEIEVYTRP